MKGNSSLPGQDTRENILYLLKIGGPKTIDDLSQTLKISSMGVRQHLISLEDEGFVRHRTERRGVGRPCYLYSLARSGDELFPRSYAQLGNNLLDTIRDLDGEVGVEKIFKRRTEKLAVQYQTRIAGKSLVDQVKELAQIRTEEGYMAEWEMRDEDTFVLHEHNCAILQVACNCTQACDYEKMLFRQVLDGAEVNRESHIASGGQKCTYVIQRKT